MPKTRAPLTKPPQSGRQKTRRLVTNIVLQIIAMVAIGLLVYPDAANWFATMRHNSEVSGYLRRVQETPSAQRQRILDAAYEYNQQLTPGPLTDPYVSLSEDEAARSDVYLAYEQLLCLSGTDAIETVNYPRLGIGLPVFHGTSDEVISKGVGHLYGTSLPVGGPSTRSVLTAHSGLPHARLFSTLLDAKVGDEFWISVLG